jgi:hypothetical protein
MARQSSTNKHAARRGQQVAALHADLARLRELTADCYSSACPCHRREWSEISAIRALLGEDPTV